MKGLFRHFCGVAVVFAVFVMPAGANDDQNYDAVIQNLVPLDGPHVPTFRGSRLHAITFQTDKAADALMTGFDVEFGWATALSQHAKEVIGQRRPDFAFQTGADRFVVEGQTETTAVATEKFAISQQRAGGAVGDYIVREFAVDFALIKAMRLDEARPLDPTNPSSGVNRRVHVATFAH